MVRGLVRSSDGKWSDSDEVECEMAGKQVLKKLDTKSGGKSRSSPFR